MTDEDKKKNLEYVKQQHPVGAKRKYYGHNAEVIGYEQVESGYVYVICNVEREDYGFSTKYLTPTSLKK